MKCSGHNAMHSLTAKIHVACGNIRHAKTPYFIELAFAKSFSLMPHYCSIVTSRIMFALVVTLLDLVIIIDIHHGNPFSYYIKSHPLLSLQYQFLCVALSVLSHLVSIYCTAKIQIVTITLNKKRNFSNLYLFNKNYHQKSAIALSIILIVLFIAFIAWQAFKNIPEHKGRDGEFHVYNILAQLPEEYPVLDDVVLKTNSCTTQIDHVVVPCYKVFAIETKNYCGYIYGNDDQLLATKRSYSSTSMSDADVTSGQPLTQQNVRDQVDDRAHVSNVYAAKYKTDSKIASGICTQCGALVLRHGRYGTFYGCSNYPRCRFTKN